MILTDPIGYMRYREGLLVDGRDLVQKPAPLLPPARRTRFRQPYGNSTSSPRRRASPISANSAFSIRTAPRRHKPRSINFPTRYARPPRFLPEIRISERTCTTDSTFFGKPSFIQCQASHCNRSRAGTRPLRPSGVIRNPVASISIAKCDWGAEKPSGRPKGIGDRRLGA